MTHSPIPATTITVAITPNTTSGALPLPIHPTILAFWIQYFADRIQCVIQDSTVSHFDRQEWLNEMLDDLADLASQGHLNPTDRQKARALANAQQAFIFHDGPDPDTDATLRAQCYPDWSGLQTPAQADASAEPASLETHE